MTPRAEAVLSLTIAASLGVFFFAPVVPYRDEIPVPGNARMVCQLSTTTIGGNSRNTTATYQACTTANLPPAQMVGYSTLSYLTLGAGSPPFPQTLLVTQGNKTVLVATDGQRAVSAEVLGPAGTTLGFPGALRFVRATFNPTDFGQYNLTVVVKNDWKDRILNPVVILFLTGSGYSQDSNGLLWAHPEPVGLCGSPFGRWMDPGDLCRLSTLMSLPGRQNLDFVVEVRGYINGSYIVWRESYSESILPPTVGPGWVGDFVGQVNSARTGAPLTESHSLDDFAALRFGTASSQPDISDFNFTNDAVAFFGASVSGVSEAMLYPGGQSPGEYASYLNSSAPGHWSLLTDTTYSHYGYYVGQAPYYQVSANCPVTEIPSAGINITQYFESKGCTVTPLLQITWLVIVLGP